MLIDRQSTDLGLTIAALSKKSGVSERTIYNAKAGKQPIQPALVEAIEEALKLRPGELAKLLPAAASSEHRSQIARKAGLASSKSRRKSLSGTS